MRIISKLKSKIRRKVARTYDANYFLSELIEFMIKTRIVIHDSIDNYDERRLSRSRLVQCYVLRLFIITFYIRFVLPAIFPKQWLIELVSNPLQLFFVNGTRIDNNYFRLLSLMISQGPLIILILLMILQLTEVKYTNTQYNFIIDYIKRRHLHLSYKNERKLSIKSNLVYIILIKVILPPLILFILMCFITSNILLYMDSNYNFSMLSIIFFNITFIFFLWQFFGLIFIAIIHCTFTVLYIRYKFYEINDRFLLCLRFKNFSHLQIIAQHNHICQLIQDINQIYKWYIFILYYFANPTLLVLLKISQGDNLNLIGKLFIIIVFIVIFGGCIVANLFSSRVNKALILPLKYLHRYMAENQLPLKQRLKTMEMIERLSGPDIGFYCYDLFPMNSYEFYLYVANCCMNYFLINDLL